MNEIAMTAEHPSATYLDVATASQNMNALKMKHNLLIEAMSDVLKKDKDYGVIPGTGNKPTLLKPGAESLCFLFGLRPTFEVVDCIEDWDKGLFYYRYRCTLLSGDGRVVANSEGSCNSRETKYRYRNQSRKCPTCGKETIIKGKAEYGGGWLCFKKKGGCGAKFQDGAQVIEKQDVGKVENTEPFELVNTLQKMAQKRALVAAVLIGTGASQFFTQDVEDMSTITIDAEVVEVDFDATEPIAPKGKPAKQPQTSPKSNGNDWTTDETRLKHFWAWCGKQGLDAAQVHDALEVEHLKDYTKTLGEAKTALSKL